MEKLYVAYGSNLNIAQMALRCPTAHIYGTGLLNNWELIYRGSMTGSYATIRRRKGSAVPVVVWCIMENDEKSLDIYEGYPRFYFKQNVMVDLPSGKKKAMVYIMDLKRKPGRPNQRYVESMVSSASQYAWMPSPSRNGGSSMNNIPSCTPAEDDLISASARITDNEDLTFSPPDFDR